MLSVVTFRKDIWRSSNWRSALVWQLFYVMGLWQSGGMVERKFADQEQGEDKRHIGVGLFRSIQKPFGNISDKI